MGSHGHFMFVARPSEVAVAKPAMKTAALAIAMKSVTCTKKEVAGSGR